MASDATPWNRVVMNRETRRLVSVVKRYLSWGARYRPWLHSLKNEPATPIVVWALARKPNAATLASEAPHASPPA